MEVGPEGGELGDDDGYEEVGEGVPPDPYLTDHRRPHIGGLDGLNSNVLTLGKFEQICRGNKFN